MKINNISGTNFNGIQVRYKDNPNRKFLANELVDIFRENIGKISGTFTNDFVEISYCTEKVKKSLIEKGIKFIEDIEKHDK